MGSIIYVPPGSGGCPDTDFGDTIMGSIIYVPPGSGGCPDTDSETP